MPSGSILASHGTSWVYTSVQDFALGLRHSEPLGYAKHKAIGRDAKAHNFGGPITVNGIVNQDLMYEVFIDKDGLHKIS